MSSIKIQFITNNFFVHCEQQKKAVQCAFCFLVIGFNAKCSAVTMCRFKWMSQ